MASGVPLGDDPGVTARSNRPDPPTPRPLSNWTIAAGALLVLAVAAVVGFVLLRLYGGQGAQVQLDVIRTAGTLVIGTGGAVALLLTARRQRYTELALVHTDRAATERRITELYTKAADQLGSEKAPVRLAGLYALERLAHSTVEHRQSIVDVICAYLRMPYTPPQQRSYRSPGSERLRRIRALSDRPAYAMPAFSVESRRERAEQERQVRLAAQNILLRNLRVAAQRHQRWWHPTLPAWEDIRLDLTGARLLEFSLAKCQLYSADFTRAQFADEASFEGAQFADKAFFEDVQFADKAFFEGAQFTGWASFEGAQFTDKASFENVQFADEASFEGARFGGGAFFQGTRFGGGAFFQGTRFAHRASFENVQFADEASFEDAQFGGGAFFQEVRFGGGAFFQGARFGGWAIFEGVQFSDGAFFEDAQAALAAKQGTVWPQGWTTRPANPGNRWEDSAFLYLTQNGGRNPPDA